jgi:hypothetical protein
MDGHPYSSRPRQFYAPRPDILTDLVGGGSPVKATFRVPMPDSRVRCKVTVLYSPVPQGNDFALPVDITGFNSAIWLGLEEIDWAGRVAGPVPVTNLIVNPTTGLLVTRAAPLAIPSDANVMGFSEEFVTAGDQIFGELTTTYVPGAPGRWMLYTRYQPDGLYLPPDEWQEICNLCTPRAITRVVTGGGNA